MGLFIYMDFPGNASEVIKYYSKVFKTPKPEIMYFKDMPPSEDFPVSPEFGNMIMHATIMINDDSLMFSDVPPGSDRRVVFGNNITILYSSKDIDELSNYFNEMAKDGEIITPFGETFFTKAYGMVKDKFGITWQYIFDE